MQSTLKAQRYFFIGIGGIGMSALAFMCQQAGHTVAGCDRRLTPMANTLTEQGIEVSLEADIHDLSEYDVIVYSSAISLDHRLRRLADQQQKHCCHRAELLAQLTAEFEQSVVITGTHGKTTTTSLLTHILQVHGADPTYYIGAQVHHAAYHAAYRPSAFAVIEGDESDASFMEFAPQRAILHNLDYDHMATYEHSLENLQAHFITFANQTDQCFICLDEPGIQAIVPQIHVPVLTYGFHPQADVHALNYHIGQQYDTFDLHYQDQHYPGFELPLPGRHNVRNALAAISYALTMNIPVATIQQALKSFHGTKRRFDRYQAKIGSANVLLIDDYGHHPAEVSSTLETIEQHFPKQRLIHVFQPHRFSRTQALFNEWVKALQTSDVLLLMDTFSAGEAPIPGATSRDLATYLQQQGHDHCIAVGHHDNVIQWLTHAVKPNDIILFQGAGDVTQLVDHYVTR